MAVVAVADIPEVGVIVGEKYRVIGRLGQGGMGVVLEAEHITLGQRVALKVLSDKLGVQTPRDVERFEREARALAKLTSPHIVRVLDAGRLTASGAPWFTMEKLEGESLAKRAARGPIEVGELVRWLREVCAGIGEAHAAGIVHRDLKPANIFLTAAGIARVLDFGIAKIEGASALTETNTTLGSPSYMAPEQLRGARDIDSTCDVFAIGVILYRLLARRFPYEGGSFAELALAHEASVPPGLDALCPELPRGLTDVVMRAIATRRSDRFPSAAALSSALEPYAQAATSATPKVIVMRSPVREPSSSSSSSQEGRKGSLFAISVLGTFSVAAMAAGVFALSRMNNAHHEREQPAPPVPIQSTPVTVATLSASVSPSTTPTPPLSASAHMTVKPTPSNNASAAVTVTLLDCGAYADATQCFDDEAKIRARLSSCAPLLLDPPCVLMVDIPIADATNAPRGPASIASHCPISAELRACVDKTMAAHRTGMLPKSALPKNPDPDSPSPQPDRGLRFKLWRPKSS